MKLLANTSILTNQELKNYLIGLNNNLNAVDVLIQLNTLNQLVTRPTVTLVVVLHHVMKVIHAVEPFTLKDVKTLLLISSGIIWLSLGQ